MNFDIAITPENIININYQSNINFYSRVENFQRDTHSTSLSYKLTQPKGSTFKIRGNVNYYFIQPFSEEELSKDYILSEVFADTLFKLGEVVDLGLRYDYQSREFDDKINEIDDYERNTVTLDLEYQVFTVTDLLFECI